MDCRLIGRSPSSGTRPSLLLLAIDIRELSDVVKEEVKGGESSEGPTPFDHLWQPSKAALIKDEPLVVTVPLGLPPLTPKVYVPAANPITKGKYELGRQLYFDPRVSLNATVSCATCHNPARGWTDAMAVSIGIAGQTGSRSAPSVVNVAYGKTMFWDGRTRRSRARLRDRYKTRLRWANNHTRTSWIVSAMCPPTSNNSRKSSAPA